MAGLILAAGAGRRFGSVKQLASFRGRPLVEHAVRAMEDAGVDPLYLVLGADAERILAAADTGRARAVITPRWRLGQSESLKQGLRAALADQPDLGGVVVTLGDQPLISPLAIRRVLESAQAAAAAEVAPPLAVRATYEGRPGHPVALMAELFSALTELEGDRGAAQVIEQHPVEYVSCEGFGCDLDADTEAGLERLRSVAED